MDPIYVLLVWTGPFTLFLAAFASGSFGRIWPILVGMGVTIITVMLLHFGTFYPQPSDMLFEGDSETIIEIVMQMILHLVEATLLLMFIFLAIRVYTWLTKKWKERRRFTRPFTP
jgi:Ni,Fe-hydrogenase I cytochrome b subunit